MRWFAATSCAQHPQRKSTPPRRLPVAVGRQGHLPRRSTGPLERALRHSGLLLGGPAHSVRPCRPRSSCPRSSCPHCFGAVCSRSIGPCAATTVAPVTVSQRLIVDRECFTLADQGRAIRSASPW